MGSVVSGMCAAVLVWPAIPDSSSFVSFWLRGSNRRWAFSVVREHDVRMSAHCERSGVYRRGFEGWKTIWSVGNNCWRAVWKVANNIHGDVDALIEFVFVASSFPWKRLGEARHLGGFQRPLGVDLKSVQRPVPSVQLRSDQTNEERAKREGARSLEIDSEIATKSGGLDSLS